MTCNCQFLNLVSIINSTVGCCTSGIYAWISKGINTNSIVLITTDMDTSMCSIIDNFLDNVFYDSS